MAEKKLVFDESSAKYYENGVDHGILAVMSGVTYGTPVVWNGLTSVSQSPEGGEAEDIYADNIKYASLTSTENFKATINAYTYPDEFAVCDGSVAFAGTDGKKGLLIGQQKRSHFGFAYRTNKGNADGTQYHIIHIVYNCLANPSEREYTSVNDSPEAIEFSWEISSTPDTASYDGVNYTTSHVTIDESLDKDTYDNIEKILIGDGIVDPKFPTLAEVFEQLSTKE